MWDCYHNRRNPLPELTHEEFSEVFMLLKQPFSLIRERLSELMSTKHWPLQWSLVLYDISGMTFPVSREDGKLVSEIMSHQREHYETRVKPYEGLPSQWDDEFDYDDEADDRSWLEKAKCRVRWEFSKLISHFRKPWPPPGIEQQLSGRIYEQSSDALLQLRFTWGRNGSPELDFVPMKPLEHFRFGFNGEFICYSWYHPSTGGGYPWCELIPILENPTGNDADWRFKDGYVFEYCLKDESKDSPDASIVLNSDEE